MKLHRSQIRGGNAYLSCTTVYNNRRVQLPRFLHSLGRGGGGGTISKRAPALPRTEGLISRVQPRLAMHAYLRMCSACTARWVLSSGIYEATIIPVFMPTDL